MEPIGSAQIQQGLKMSTVLIPEAESSKLSFLNLGVRKLEEGRLINGGIINGKIWYPLKI